jgi:hypothetical protein
MKSLFVAAHLVLSVTAVPRQHSVHLLNAEQEATLDFNFDAGSNGIKMFANPKTFSWDPAKKEIKGSESGKGWGDNHMENYQLGDKTILKTYKGWKNHAFSSNCGGTDETCDKYVKPIQDMMVALYKTKHPEYDENTKPEVQCMIAATAGNRPKKGVQDNAAWGRLIYAMRDSPNAKIKCNFRKPPNVEYSSHLTVPGTQEALFEAQATLTSETNTDFAGYHTTGGASAQYGLHLCNNEVATKWAKVVKDKGKEVTEGSCHKGTDTESWMFMSWSTIQNIVDFKADNLKEKTDAFEKSCKGENEGKCWALGSFLQCPAAGFADLGDVADPEDPLPPSRSSCGVG